MTFKMPPTPECDKISARRDEHEAIVGFVRWLDDQAETLCIRVKYCRCNHCNACDENHEEDPGNCDCDCEWTKVDYKFLNDSSKGSLLARYFGIDEWKMEDEKRAIMNAYNRRIEYERSNHHRDPGGDTVPQPDS